MIRPLSAALLFATFAAQAQTDVVVQQPPPLPGVYGGGTMLECPQPQYPREALRYELEGSTQVALLIGDDGKAHGKRVVKSSGWKMLDSASMDFLSACSFSPITRDGKPAGAHWKTFQYVWTLQGSREKPATPPAIQRENCAAADRIAIVASPRDGSGILLRFLTNAQGEAFGVKLEGSSGNDAVDAEAIRALTACRFTPSLRDGKPGPGNAFARYQAGSAFPPSN
jgi:TonB family protein